MEETSTRGLTSVLLEEEREKERARCIAAVESVEIPFGHVPRDVVEEALRTGDEIVGAIVTVSAKRIKESIIKRIKGEEP